MTELPGKIRVQDATLANMVSIAAILEYLDNVDPGCKERIESRALDIARGIKSGLEGTQQGQADPGQELEDEE
jgi:hypothetical protein